MVKQHFQSWKEREALAESMIPLIGRLYRDKNVVTSVYGRSIINRSVIDILKAHKFVQQVQDSGLSVRETFPILEALNKMNLAPCRIDIGKLATGYLVEVTGIRLKSTSSKHWVTLLIKDNRQEPGVRTLSFTDLVV